MATQKNITPLEGSYDESGLENLDPHLEAFINKFPSNSDLAWLSEPQLLQQSKYDGLGYIWAAMGIFLRKDQFARGVYGPQPPVGSSRLTRQAAAMARESTQTEPEERHVLGSTLPPSMSPTPSATSGYSGSSLGYIESISSPLVEDASVHLVSSVIRYILNFKQAPSKAKPLTWRDQKIRYSFSRGQGLRDVVAEDDGGVQVWIPGSQNFRQIILLEAKRALMANGQLQVTDGVLAQMVAQAIAIQRAGQASTYTAVKQNLSITVLATNRFLRFYTFEFDNDYLQQYESRGMGANGCYLRIHTTQWMDIAVQGHRKQLLRHLSAILKWADTQ